MIPHSTAGVQQWGYPPRAANSGAGRVDVAQFGGQFDPHSERLSTPRPLSRTPAVVDPSAKGSEAHQREPPAKRLKTDAPGGSLLESASPGSAAGRELKSTPGPANSRPSSVPWRSRPVWSFQGLLSDIPTVEPRGENAPVSGQRDERASPPPLPTLPWKNALGSVEGSSSRSRESSLSKEVQTTPYRIQVPDAAPALDDKKIADFVPWTGNHPEDVLNEQTAKQGYYDRTHLSQNESNTARPTLHAQLKQSPGLEMLSSVFSAALEKRHDHNVVNTPSTFKPPPRVTLTDNKRETWLRDLANSSVPLRRLSRTIPHGIRGKVLLEQCLSKWIPAGRAVWLAKCVGANEIRAFKRKGTSGALAIGLEVKWVRDWTTNVQQFLEAVMHTCGAPDWKTKMRYAVGLTARLFFEHLLDHDQYLEWFLSSLEAASISTLPLWLLMLGIYWDNVMRYRKRGRRLAEALLEKLREVTNSGQVETLQQLNDRLSRCIWKLVREHTSSAVLPNSWDRYKDLVLSCLDFKDNADKAIFRGLVERNVRVQRLPGCQQTAQCTPRQRVIQLLDSRQRALDISSVSAACLDTIDDRTTLVSCVLEWSATPFRNGLCRVYTSVRLLRKWKMRGIDVDSHILSFLAGTRGDSALNMDNVYHAISELVRSQTFSVGKYLQWVMARGIADNSPTGSQKDMPADIGLLTQLPTNRLQDHVSNLRNTLFTRLGFSSSEETSAIATVKASISHRLPKIFESRADDVMIVDSSQPNLTWAVKAEVGQWVRNGVAEHYLNSTREITGAPISIDPEISALTPEEFYALRDILESFEDLSMLADVLKHATNCDDSVVLASAADTLSYHLDSFFVIGAATDLFRRLFEAYTRLKRLGTASLDLLFSLMDLGFQIPSELNTVILLRQDFSRMENRSAMAVSSPVSDHIPEISSDSDPSLYAKLDQILSSGGGIDESTWDTTFNALIKALESASVQAKVSGNDTCRYLAQLRPFYPKRFDGMLISWVCGVLKSSARPSLLEILPPLIGVGCVTIHAFMGLVRKHLQHDNGGQTIPNIDMLRMDLVELLVSRPLEQGGYFDLVSYRFHLAQQEYLVKHPEEAMDIAREAAASMNVQGQDSGFNPRKSNLATIMKLLQILITQSPSDTAERCMQGLTSQQPGFVSALQKTLDDLLDFDLSTGQNPNVSEAEKVISLVDDFSLPFCQLKLQILFNAESKEESKGDIVDVMFNAAVSDSGAKRSHWVNLVDLMSRDAVRQIRERAEKEFFSMPLLENLTEDTSVTAGTASVLETAMSYLSIIDQLASSIPDTGVPSVAPVLVEKMDLLLHRVLDIQTKLSHTTDDRDGTTGEQTKRFRANFERATVFWFSALLRLVVIHRPAFGVPSAGAKPSNLPEQSRLLISIFCISLSLFSNHMLRFFPTADYFPRRIQPADSNTCPGVPMQTHALDVAASLIDTFPDEARYQCARFLKGRCPPFVKFQNDVRIAYLLGPMADFPPSTSLSTASVGSPAAPGSTPAPTPTPSNNLPPGSQQPSAPSEGPNSVSSHLRFQYRGRVIGGYPLRPWELLEDAAPVVGVNDTAISLGYFDARRARA